MLRWIVLRLFILLQLLQLCQGCKKAEVVTTEVVTTVVVSEEEEGQVIVAKEYNKTTYIEHNKNNTGVENGTESDFDFNDLRSYLDETDDDDDSQVAFADVEDEESLCGGEYTTEKPRKKVLPAAVIIGTKKGGTRALLEFLNMHSLVRRSKYETHFYDKNFAKGTEWYVEQMPEVFAGQISLEKTPGYFHTPGVPRRLFQTKNSTKLILIVRNPATRLISDYNQFRSNTLERNLTYPSLAELVLTASRVVSDQYPPVQRSKYHIHMQTWLDIFPRQQLLVVDGDNFIREPWTELERVERFLELPHELTEDNFYFNTTKGFFCGRQVLTRPSSNWSCRRTKCLSKSKGRKKPRISSNLVSLLAEYFVPHNEIFFQQIGKSDFEWSESL